MQARLERREAELVEQRIADADAEAVAKGVEASAHAERITQEVAKIKTALEPFYGDKKTLESVANQLITSAWHMPDRLREFYAARDRAYNRKAQLDRAAASARLGNV